VKAAVMDESSPPEMVEVSYTDLSEEALRAVIHDIVTRDGTDYGAVEKTSEQKAAALMHLLQRGEATLAFDPETETLSVLTKAELSRLTRGVAQRG
jgi:uncharacterized protein YheU (UPF0270 family)